MRRVFAITVTLCAVGFVTACAPGRVLGNTPDWRNARIVVQPWEEEATSSAFEPLDAQMQQFAADAELACLRRSFGDRPNESTGSSAVRAAQKVYILSDQPLVFPEDMPNYVLVRDIQELERLARETKQDIQFGSVRTLGQTKVKGKKGVVIHHSYSVVDWQRAEWEALSPAEKEGRATPEFRVWLYGGGGQVFVTRNGNKWLVLEGQMIVS